VHFYQYIGESLADFAAFKHFSQFIVQKFRLFGKIDVLVNIKEKEL
jgi:hypothetical protein